MSKGEWIIQLTKIVFGIYFVWWSLLVLVALHSLAIIEIANTNLLRP